MTSQPKTKFASEEYLVIDRQSEHRNEYFDGEIFAMTGASRKHNLITANVTSLLHLQLKDRQCEVYASTLSV